jgi:hypothetical protein
MSPFAGITLPRFELEMILYLRGNWKARPSSGAKSKKSREWLPALQNP